MASSAFLLHPARSKPASPMISSRFCTVGQCLQYWRGSVNLRVAATTKATARVKCAQRCPHHWGRSLGTRADDASSMGSQHLRMRKSANPMDCATFGHPPRCQPHWVRNIGHTHPIATSYAGQRLTVCCSPNRERVVTYCFATHNSVRRILDSVTLCEWNPTAAWTRRGCSFGNLLGRFGSGWHFRLRFRLRKALAVQGAPKYLQVTQAIGQIRERHIGV